MGQALRRASGRIRTSSSIDPAASSPAPKSKIAVDRPPPVVSPTDELKVPKTSGQDTTDSGEFSAVMLSFFVIILEIAGYGGFWSFRLQLQ